MYDKMLEQAESFFKPVNDILQLNAEIFETIRVKQTDLVNDVLADSLEYAKDLSVPSLDVDSYICAQQSYWQGIQSKITLSAQDNYELLNDVQGKFGGLLKGAWDVNDSPGNVVEDVVKEAAVNDAAPAPVKAKAPAKKKPAAKKTPKVAAAKAETKKVETKKSDKIETAKVTPKIEG